MLWRIAANGEMRLVVFMAGQAAALHRDMWPHYTDQLARPQHQHQHQHQAASLVSQFMTIQCPARPQWPPHISLLNICIKLVPSAPSPGDRLLAPGVLLHFAPLSNLCMGRKHKKWRATSTKDFILLGLAQKPGWQICTGTCMWCTVGIIGTKHQRRACFLTQGG